MMYYGGASWLWMGLSMIAFWAVVIALVVWAARSLSRNTAAKPPPSVALSILQERFAKGEISREEFDKRIQLIHGVG